MTRNETHILDYIANRNRGNCRRQSRFITAPSVLPCCWLASALGVWLGFCPRRNNTLFLNIRARGLSADWDPLAAGQPQTSWQKVTFHLVTITGQDNARTVYTQYFWHGNHQIYGHIRCMYTVLANPTYGHRRHYLLMQSLSAIPLWVFFPYILQLWLVARLRKSKTRWVCVCMCVCVCLCVCVCV